MRALSVMYLGLVTVLLLVENPLGLLGLRGSSGWILRDVADVAHFVVFVGLAILVLAARWRVPRGMLFLLLGTYALCTELLQAFVPTRTPSISDLLQDFAGIAVGGLIWWVGLGILRRVTASSARGQDRAFVPAWSRVVEGQTRGEVADRTSSQ